MHILELILKTASIQRTKLFYSKTLELPLVKESEEQITFRAGSSLLTFEAVQGQKPVYHFAFNVTNNKFSDSFEWISQKLDILPLKEGVPIAAYPNWNAEAFYFYDNNGNILEFLARFDLPYYSAEPFGVHDIVEISEAGIVTDDVPQTRTELSGKFNISLFSKGPDREDFSVLGDDHGLLIISQRCRPWVPTNKPAEPFPITIITDTGTIVL